MNLQDLGKPLDINQIDFRIQTISKSGYALMLAYKDARVDMDRLDTVVGRGKWQRKHDLIDGQLFCSIGLYNEEIGQWVWVQDVGTESNTEKEKGRASDSFKRACFNLGIGRELYEFPLILIKLNKNEFEEKEWQGKKKIQATWDLKLKEWAWTMERDDHGITLLTCSDEKGAVRYTYKRAESPVKTKAVEPESAEQEQEKSYEDLVHDFTPSITKIKGGIANDELSTAAEEWFTLSKDVQMALWRAPSKGGCFTTKEREIMKTPEFRQAYYGPDQKVEAA